MSRDEIEMRFRYHPPKTEVQVHKHSEVNRLTCELAHELNDLLPEGREKALVFTRLEEVRMRSNQALAMAQAAQEATS